MRKHEDNESQIALVGLRAQLSAEQECAKVPTSGNEPTNLLTHCWDSSGMTGPALSVVTSLQRPQRHFAGRLVPR